MRFLLALSFLFTSGCALNYLSPSEILQVSAVVNEVFDDIDPKPELGEPEEAPAPDAGTGDAAIPET